MAFLEFHRKHRQHRNDIEALYAISTKTNQRVDVIDRKVSSVLEVQHEHSAQLRGVQATLETHTELLAAHEARFDRIDARLDRMDARLDGHDTKLETINARLDGQSAMLDNQGKQLNQILDLLRAQRPETN